MLRLYVFAEGRSEQTFADTVLNPHLNCLGIYIYPRLIGNATSHGVTHRGGVSGYERIRKDISRLSEQEKSRGDVFFTTMIDLYALPKDFPAKQETKTLPPHDRVAALENAFAADVNDPRFIPYIQLHEFEAYLFADVFCFRQHYEIHERELTALQAIRDQYTTPELIDDGPHTAPSKRIIAHLPDYEYAKAVIGPRVAELIGLPTIRRVCPHFNAWVTRIEQLRPLK